MSDDVLEESTRFPLESSITAAVRMNMKKSGRSYDDQEAKNELRGVRVVYKKRAGRCCGLEDGSIDGW